MRIVTNDTEAYWQSAASYFFNNIAMRPTFSIAGVFLDNPYAGAINGSLWTLPIELTLYFLLILYIKVISLIDNHSKYAKIVFSVAVLMLLSWVDVWYVNLQGRIIPNIWPMDLTSGVILTIYFFIGVSFQLLELKRLCSWQIGILTIVLWACLPTLLQNIVTPYLMGYIVICFALTEKPLFSNLFKRDICYGMYLYAFPVQQVLIWLFLVKLNLNFSVYILFLISLLVIIILARMQYWMIEEKGLYAIVHR